MSAYDGHFVRTKPTRKAKHKCMPPERSGGTNRPGIPDGEREIY